MKQRVHNRLAMLFFDGDAVIRIKGLRDGLDIMRWHFITKIPFNKLHKRIFAQNDCPA
jgi:hypothetical protein